MANDYYFSKFSLSNCWQAWLLVAGLLLSGLGVVQGQCLPAANCQPGSAPANLLNLNFGILRVQLANVDTTTNGAADGYQDYSCRRAVRLDRGTTYTLRVTTGPNADEQLRAWLDFNQDGVFNPTTELVLSSMGRQHAGSFTVPASLAPGTALRLRLAADYVDAPLPGPCTTPQYSQTEDYRIVVTTVSAPRPVAQFGALDSVICLGTVQLRDRSRNAPTNWYWDFGDGTTSTQQHPTHFYAAPGTYTVGLRACNPSGCDSLSRTAFITVRADGPKAAPCQPSTIVYCCDFGLARVQLAGLDHRPGGGAAGYQDASCAYRATLRADWPDTLRLTTGGQNAHDVRVYLDLDNDGQFNATTELLYQGLSVKNPLIPLRLSSLTAGLVYNTALRLRICADYAGSPAIGPCAAPKWGQVADYSVLVLPNTLLPQATFQLRYTRVCGPVTVAFTNTSKGGTSYHWDFGDGTTSVLPVPVMHTYPTAGIYKVRLISYNTLGGDSMQQVVAVAANCPTYCQPLGTGGSADYPTYATRVQLGTLDNKTLRNPGVAYQDFTAQTTTLQAGQPYTLRAESLPWQFAGFGPWLRVGAWIDYNQDGSFTSDELLTVTPLSYSPHNLSFTVPLSAKPGATRLRVQVSSRVETFANWGTCISAAGYDAATEDYTVLLLPATTAPQAGFTADNLFSCTGVVQLRDTSWAMPTQWQWQFGDGVTSTQQNPQHQYSKTGTYTVSLRATNQYGTSLIARTDYLIVSALAAGPRPASCVPSTGTIPYGFGIASATLGPITFAGTAFSSGYQDVICNQTIPVLLPGAVYPLIVSSLLNASSHVYLWLDINDDGAFDPMNELLCATTTQAYSANPQSGTFTVPPTAIRNRPLRLRLYWAGDYPPWVPDPCSRDQLFGQVRDFAVTIGNVTATQPALSLSKPAWTAYPNPTTGQIRLEVRWSGETGENWVVISQPHGKSLFLQTAAL